MVESDDRLGIRFECCIAAPRALAVGKGGKLARRDVTQIAGDLHRLMIAHQHDHPSPGALGLAVELLQMADDLEAVGAAIGDVAGLDQHRLSTRPAVG